MIVNNEKYDRFDEQESSRRIDGEYQGTVVSSVLKGGAAWTAGVRAGDILQATSATMGNQMWPKSTVEGVRSAMQSRKATSSSIEMEFQRIGDAEDNQFELSLSKPIGMQLKGANKAARINCSTRCILTFVFYIQSYRNRRWICSSHRFNRECANTCSICCESWRSGACSGLVSWGEDVASVHRRRSCFGRHRKVTGTGNHVSV